MAIVRAGVGARTKKQARSREYSKLVRENYKLRMRIVRAILFLVFREQKDRRTRIQLKKGITFIYSQDKHVVFGIDCAFGAAVPFWGQTT